MDASLFYFGFLISLEEPQKFGSCDLCLGLFLIFARKFNAHFYTFDCRKLVIKNLRWISIFNCFKIAFRTVILN